jgi:hypothetical protein
VAALFLFWGMGLADPASAESRLLALTFRAPPECGTAAELEQSVASRVHVRERATLVAALDVAVGPEGYVAELTTAAGARRSLSAPDCRAIVETSAVILALAIDPSADTREPIHAEVAVKPLVVAPGEEPFPVELMLGAGVVVDSHTLPHFATGVRGRAGLEGSRWNASATFAYFLPQSTELGDATQGGHFTWWLFGLTGCLVPAPFRLRFELCLEPELGRLSGRGTGSGVLPDTAEALWLSFGAGAGLAVALNRRTTLRLSAGVAVTALGRHPFVLEKAPQTAGSVEVHRPGRASGRGGLELGVRF